MKHNKWLGLAGLALAVVAIPVTYAIAQEEASDQRPGIEGQGPPPPGPGQQPPGQPGQRPPMGPGGGIAMTADSEFLYILQGNNIYKFDKRDLTLKAKGTLPAPQPPGDQGRPAGPPPPQSE